MTDAFDTDRVETVLFDSYGTLVDTTAAAQAVTDLVADPEAVARDWRERALFYSVVANDLDQYATYFDLHVDALRDALRAEGVALDDVDPRERTAVYHDLDPFADVARCFERLAAAGYEPSICSNGNPEMLASLVESTGIGDSVGELVSADDVRTLKPAAELYEHAAERVDTPPERIAHVTAHWMDVQGAMHAGMQGVFLARGDDLWPSFGPDPSLTVDSLAAFCDRLGA
ncbi:haloacid dehalogenase type II [Halorientalis marina]|uniref:haloacid dehalogenase type II n=1 Tax=Halorientalis marina TaxID=2931976 RepID=UPI001FF43AC6|nr:haloacid dehalogenase type II [Halorientalis marina]